MLSIRDCHIAAARLISILCLACGAATAQTPAEWIEKIRKHVAENLRQLPNYTCGVTIGRSFREANKKKFSLLDTIKLDVAFIEGRELYAWPGSSKFEERPITKMVSGKGAIGSGTFALHARHLFTRGGITFFYRGVAEWHGRQAVHFDFDVPQKSSAFVIQDGTHSAVAPYQGSFWADATTLDLLHLEISADRIPAPVKVTAVREAVDYGKLSTAEMEFAIPAAAETTLLSPAGEARNVTRFERCRQYSAGSVISFEDPPPETAVPQGPREIEIPAGLPVEMTLETAFDARTPLGDPVTARLGKPLRDKQGAGLLPKGATLRGRISRLERRQAARFEYLVVGLVFETVEADGLRARFTARLEEAGIPTGGEYHVPFSKRPQTGPNVWTSLRHQTEPPQPNEGVFFVRTSGLRIGSGLRLVWRTE
jgi:hypothetical protein